MIVISKFCSLKIL